MDPMQQWAHHPFYKPHGILSFWLYTDAIIEGYAEVRSATNENSQWICVWRMLREKDGGTLHWVCSTS